MVISDTHRFVFVHIPKCAGTSLREALKEVNEWNKAGPPWIRNHSSLGILDYGHIPLFILREHFPEEYRALRDYWSFTVVRDPYVRIASSLSQQLTMYSNSPIHKLGLTKIKHEISRVIEYLAKMPRHNHLLPVEYIHFQKQVDFIYTDGEKIVDTIYPIQELDKLLSDVHNHVGMDQAYDRHHDLPMINRTMIHRNEAVRMIIETLRPATRLLTRALPKETKSILRSLVYVPRDRRLNTLFTSNYIRDFVRDYYREDLKLFEDGKSIRAGKASAS